ncbi:MAG: creatininase family protein [Acidimicrobiales bacterium]
MSARRLLGDLAAPDVAAALHERSIVVVPIGAVEQHGPHLPLATDTIVVEAYAEALAGQVGERLDLWFLPPLAISKSNEHAWAPGTVWLGPETVLAILRDIGRSLRMLPTRKVVFLNGHGGNTSLLDVACRELRLHDGLQTFLVHPFLPADHGGAGDPAEHGMGIHGGVSETSLLLHLRPELVHLDRAAPALPVVLDGFRHLRFGGPVGFGWLSDDLHPSGVIGDPTLASAERGAAEFAAGLQFLVEAFEEIARFSFVIPSEQPDARH